MLILTHPDPELPTYCNPNADIFAQSIAAVPRVWEGEVYKQSENDKEKDK